MDNHDAPPGDVNPERATERPLTIIGRWLGGGPRQNGVVPDIPSDDTTPAAVVSVSAEGLILASFQRQDQDPLLPGLTSGQQLAQGLPPGVEATGAAALDAAIVTGLPQRFDFLLFANETASLCYADVDPVPEAPDRAVLTLTCASHFTADDARRVEPAEPARPADTQPPVDHGVIERLERERHELQIANEAKNRFLSTFSHELKTPLTSIVAFTEILLRNRDDNLQAEQIQQLKVMDHSARRLSAMIDDLLDVTRIDSGTFELEMDEFDAHLLLEEVADSFAPILESNRQTLARSVPERRLWIRADRNRLAQVFSNLLSNASKYSHPETIIVLAAANEGSRLHVTVQDSGIGICPGDQERLFTPFFRANNQETRDKPGTGLGLAIAKSILDLHGGEIAIDSRPGAGTAVHLWIPGLLQSRRTPQPDSGAANEQPRQPTARRPGRRSGRSGS